VVNLPLCAIMEANSTEFPQGDFRVMRRWLSVFTLFGILLPPAGAVAQKTAAPAPGPMALQVRSEFLYAWNAYKQYSWGTR
jgi:hypothetical protein